MSQIKVTFSGNVVAQPERKNVAGNSVLEFPVYVNHTKKNRDTGNYEPTGDVSKIRVSLWREKAEMSDVQQGDIVEIVGTIVEKNFTRKDGTEGRSLQTDWVDSVVVKYRKGSQPKSNDSAIPSSWKEIPAEDAPF